MTNYDAQDIKAYMISKLDLLQNRKAEFTNVFTEDELNKEIQIAASVITLCEKANQAKEAVNILFKEVEELSAKLSLLKESLK